MNVKNDFYLFVPLDIYTVTTGYTYTLQHGEIQARRIQDDRVCGITSEIRRPKNVKAIKIPYNGITDNQLHNITVFGKHLNVNVWSIITTFSGDSYSGNIMLPDDITYIALSFNYANVSETKYELVYFGYSIRPHYKKLEKAYKKEDDQMFFRESLEGKITLFGEDYEHVVNLTVEQNAFVDVLQNGTLYQTATFNKTKCKFDQFICSVELKLTPNDDYTEILNAYDNEYNLIKLAPAISSVNVTKRCMVQIYFQGENVVSNYFGGTYYEDSVTEAQDDPDKLQNMYHFARGPKFIEISFPENYTDYPRINGVYECVKGNTLWKGYTQSQLTSSIRFIKEYNAGDYADNVTPCYLMSNGQRGGLIGEPAQYIYDTYRIYIINNGQGDLGTNNENVVYKSTYIYGNDSDFILSNGNGLYEMTAYATPTPPFAAPTPEHIYLGEHIIEYNTWARLICDAPTYERNGETFQTYDLRADDFALQRRNFKKCVGLVGFDSPTAVIHLYENTAYSNEPTSYGMDDYGKYFMSPQSPSYVEGPFIPVNRSTWANIATWAYFESSSFEAFDLYERWCEKMYTKFTLKDCYHIADVIKVMLNKIDPTIRHEATSEYSQFLYGTNNLRQYILNNTSLYIAPKSNVLAGNYDQAAQKAPISFKQIMNMLRDCFKCYWFIDNQHRFRIEHISYFLNGMSYSSANVQYNLADRLDRFNKKEQVYGQKEVEYKTDNLSSRIEFAWADDVTDVMGNINIDVHSNYIAKDKIDSITVDSFTSDIDFMLFAPEKFSEDGFALILADNNKNVPIINVTLSEEKQNGKTYIANVQNWYASWNNLIKLYMYDMPAPHITYNNLPNGSIRVHDIKRCKQIELEYQDDTDPDIYELITSYLGNGYIEEVSVNIDTRMIRTTLLYGPQ